VLARPSALIFLFGAAVLVPKAKDVAAVFGFVAGEQSTFRWGDVSCNKVSGLL
jgi:hypothetical protein